MNPLAIEGAAEVRALVLTGYGLNCEAETCAALQMIGARVTARHVADAIADADALAGHQLVVFIGGFSFGDHIASGRVFANRLRFSMGERLLRHVDDGGLVLGICNGFQTIVKLGLCPGSSPAWPSASRW
ncbi:phosphoribosylformylglycinamidine synthase subunit PurQ [Nannocystis pusilla]|uniref:phosphoribosylformylglycinamidine synthase subunit PurQ n=1 Tax=Nannocystis pusilla TaxID=889268 RepID=UPI003B7B4846